jgi:hypothetical protein
VSLAEGAALAIVPLLLDAGRAVRGNLSLDAGLLDAIDEAAKAHGLTRSAFLASAAREKIEGRAGSQGMPIDTPSARAPRNDGAIDDLVEEIMEIGRHCAALPLRDTRSPDEIIGYDEHGLPQ